MEVELKKKKKKNTLDMIEGEYILTIYFKV